MGHSGQEPGVRHAHCPQRIGLCTEQSMIDTLEFPQQVPSDLTPQPYRSSCAGSCFCRGSGASGRPSPGWRKHFRRLLWVADMGMSFMRASWIHSIGRRCFGFRSFRGYSTYCNDIFMIPYLCYRWDDCTPDSEHGCFNRRLNFGLCCSLGSTEGGLATMPDRTSPKMEASGAGIRGTVAGVFFRVLR